MAMDIQAQNLKALIDRFSKGAIDHVVTLEKTEAWLETFLQEWVLNEEKFFTIALEKEEMDMYNRALSLHLIGEDEVTPRDFTLHGYQRPSAIRHAVQTAQERETAERYEMNSLKERRRILRQSLTGTNRLLSSLTSKLVDIKTQVSELDHKLVELGRKCDTLVSISAQAILDDLGLLSTGLFPSVQSSSLLQKVSFSLQKKFQFIEELSSNTYLLGVSPEDFRQASWLLGRAFHNLEDRLYQEELLMILEGLEKEVPWVPIEANDAKEKPPSVSTAVTDRLHHAWRRDEMVKLSYREGVTSKSGEILRTQILPPLALLYCGLRSLQAYVSNVHAQCVVLSSEFKRFAQALHENDSQALLNEDDDLLIRLSTLLRLDPEQGELSTEAVLDQLVKIKLESQQSEAA